MALTRGQIIGEALSQIGRADLTSNGRLWLNLFLDKIYKTQDWSWLLKDAGVLSLTDGGAVPSDYWKLKNAFALDNGSVVGNIRSVTNDEWSALKARGSATGVPVYVYIDEDTKTFNFWPTPDKTYTWHPFYYYLPTIPTHTDGSGDTAAPKWGLHDDVLIRAVQLKALYYNDDKRYQTEIQEVMKEIVDAKMNSGDFRAGRNRLKFGKSFRRRF